MALKLSTRPVQTFPLIKSDSSGETTVTIRQAPQAAIEDLGDLISETTRQRGSDKYVTRFNPVTAQAIQVYHSMVSCDIQDAQGNPLFPSKEVQGYKSLAFTNLAEFKKAWDLCDPAWCNEIYECVIKMNPIWDMQEEEKNDSALNSAS